MPLPGQCPTVNVVDVHLTRARQALRDAVAVVPHTDADGLAAGAIALRARGEGAADAILLERGADAVRATTHPLPDGPLAVARLGRAADPQRPGVLVDHHVPEAAAQDPTSSWSPRTARTPSVPTAPLMRRVAPRRSRRGWPRVGAVGDLGDSGFALPECAGARAKTRDQEARRARQRAAAAARRPGAHRARPARRARRPAPAALRDPRIAELEEAKARVAAEFDRVVRTPPRVERARGG